MINAAQAAPTELDPFVFLFVMALALGYVVILAEIRNKRKKGATGVN